MTTLDILWQDETLPIIADYYEDLGDSVGAEALHWIISNNYKPYSLEDNHAYGYWFGTDKLTLNVTLDDLELIKRCVLPDAVWQQMTSLVSHVYYKRYDTPRSAYEAVIQSYKLAREKGWKS